MLVLWTDSHRILSFPLSSLSVQGFGLRGSFGIQALSMHSRCKHISMWPWSGHGSVTEQNVCNFEYCVLTLMINGFCEWNIWECKLLYHVLMSVPWLDPMLLIFAIVYCTFSYWNTIICSIHYYWSCAGWTLYHTADVKAQSHNKRERQYGIS